MFFFPKICRCLNNHQGPSANARYTFKHSAYRIYFRFQNYIHIIQHNYTHCTASNHTRLIEALSPPSTRNRYHFSSSLRKINLKYVLRVESIYFSTCVARYCNPTYVTFVLYDTQILAIATMQNATALMHFRVHHQQQ